jgi:hypothetical protein
MVVPEASGLPSIGEQGEEHMNVIKSSLPVLLIASFIFGCTSVRVEKLNPEAPSGIPFYLTKHLRQRTETTYTIYSLNNLTVPVLTFSTVEMSVVEVLDRAHAYALNKMKPPFGTSKFTVERANNAISSLSKVSIEDSEAITDFLKGLVEGAKTLTETARAGADTATTAAPAGLFDQNEATMFEKLLARDFLLIKSTTVSLEDL